MNSSDIARLRLTSQGIAHPTASSPEEVVSHLGALQAQDYPGALWTMGLRIPGSTQSTIEQAIDARRIVRTWAMRGTLHFVPPDDVRWMLDLFAPRLISGAAARRRALEIDDEVIEQARSVIVPELQQHSVRTRNELCALLERSGIATAGQRGIHILRHLSLQKVLCFGPHQQKQPTFVLLDEWVPHHSSLTEQEALHLLALRYFTSHCPATLQDFASWSGLALGRAKIGLSSALQELQEISCGGEAYYLSKQTKQYTNNAQGFLLPGFDEFMLGYRNRSAALPNAYANRICPGGNGMFLPTIVFDGQVIGTWKKRTRTHDVVIAPELFMTIPVGQRQAFSDATTQYGKFLQKSIEIAW